MHYHAESDTLLVATMGRGAYRLTNVKETLENVRRERESGTC